MKSIKISNSIYAHVYIHKVPITLEESVIASETSSSDDYNFNKTANEIIDSLEDHWCVTLLEEIHKVCAKRIVKHWEECAPQKLKEKHYKQYLKFLEE